ncbi:hypothetical protein CSOJ01_01669 [Colletotrichum sojae]|uniref:Uncharacterized protein n=1 Tax=Colletotrichum sojae TaxID=2175907 RepID=A0A8H6N423_9PEZI|nr:hypothetical protein CSOJ01_01669 [Colletotrichum sojae]
MRKSSRFQRGFREEEEEGEMPIVLLLWETGCAMLMRLVYTVTADALVEFGSERVKLDVSTSNECGEAGDGSDVVHENPAGVCSKTGVEAKSERGWRLSSWGGTSHGWKSIQHGKEFLSAKASAEGFRGFEVMFDSLLDEMGISSDGLVYVIEKPPESRQAFGRPSSSLQLVPLALALLQADESSAADDIV